MTIDVELLRKELEYVTAHRDEWDQKYWMQRSSKTTCGTVACLAGNAVLHSDRFTVKVEQVGSKHHYNPVRASDGTWVSWLRAGREVFGLSAREADRLFDSSNTLRQLWTLASEFTDGEIEVPLDVQREHDERTATWSTVRSP